MDAIALIFYVVFLLAAFGWRTWVQWRRTGDTGVRLHAAAAPPFDRTRPSRVTLLAEAVVGRRKAPRDHA